MTSKVLVSGKHPVTVRLSEVEYCAVRCASAEMNLSPNEFIAYAAVQAARVAGYCVDGEEEEVMEN